MTFLDFLKYLISQTPRVLLGIFIFCIVAIGMPDTLLEKMGLLSIRDENLVWLWIALFLSLSMLLSNLIFEYSPSLKDFYLKWDAKRRRIEVFKNLTNDEIKILRDYIDNDILTKSFSMFSGKHKRLENYGVLYMSSEISVPGRATFDFNIAQWAKDYLKKYPEILKNT